MTNTHIDSSHYLNQICENAKAFQRNEKKLHLHDGSSSWMHYIRWDVQPLVNATTITLFE